MKKIVKVSSVLLCATMLSSMFVGCGFSDGEKIDNSKTQLNVSNYDGGFGDEWLYKAKYAFEEFYKDEVFEEGKKGVQVHITPSELNGPALLDSIKGASEQIFVAQSVYYYDYLTSGVMLDISDVLTDSLSEFGENKTIASKLQPN